MYVNSSWQCNKHDRLSQTTLLSLIFDEQTDEVQTIQILDQGGLPNGGTFKLMVNGQTTQSIYYSANYRDTLSSLRFALSRLITCTVFSTNATQFTVQFSVASDVPEMSVYQNNLTLNGVPAGKIVVNTKQNGRSTGSPYALLKNLSLNQWSIVSFDAKTRIACVAIQNNSNWIKDTEGNLKQSPLYLSIKLPDVY